MKHGRAENQVHSPSDVEAIGGFSSEARRLSRQPPSFAASRVERGDLSGSNFPSMLGIPFLAGALSQTFSTASFGVRQSTMQLLNAT